MGFIAFWRFLQPLVCTEICWMYRHVQWALAGKCLINLLFAVVHHDKLLCSPLRFFLFLYTQRSWLSDGGWLTKGEGVDTAPFITYCYFIGRQGSMWPYGEQDRWGFWPWLGPCYSVAYLLKKKLIFLFCLGPDSDAVVGRSVGRAHLTKAEML